MFLGNHFHRAKPTVEETPSCSICSEQLCSFLMLWQMDSLRAKVSRVITLTKVLYILHSTLCTSNITAALITAFSSTSCSVMLWTCLMSSSSAGLPGDICGPSCMISTPDLSCVHYKLTNWSVLQTFLIFKMYCKAHKVKKKTCAPLDSLEKSIIELLIC